MITENSVPRLAASVRLRFDRLAGGMLLLGPERGLLLNPTARAIVELCTGEHRVRDIVEALRRGRTVARATVVRDVLALLGELERRRLLSVDATAAES